MAARWATAVLSALANNPAFAVRPMRAAPVLALLMGPAIRGIPNLPKCRPTRFGCSGQGFAMVELVTVVGVSSNSEIWRYCEYHEPPMLLVITELSITMLPV